MFDDGDRHTVRAKDQFGPVGIRKADQGFVDSLYGSFKVKIAGIERCNAVYGHVVVEYPPPLVEAAPGGSARILWIQREEDNFVASRCAKMLDGLLRERVPVAHGDKAAGVNAG